MRTRASAPVSAANDQLSPLKTTSRKRRADSGVSFVDAPAIIPDSTIPCPQDPKSCLKPEPTIIEGTPRRRLKRVRFSEPNLPCELQTGLTPALRRSAISPSSSITHNPGRQTPSRRSSAPPDLAATSPHSEEVVELQYTPLSQALGGRLKRRLRRRRFSETLNELEDEHRSAEKAARELEMLRTRDASKEEKIKELTWELEQQRQLGIDMSSPLLPSAKCLPLANTANDNSIEASVGLPLSPFEDETFFSSPSNHRGRHAIPDAIPSSPLARSSPRFDERMAQGPSSEAMRDKELVDLQDQITTLTRQCSDARSALQLVHAELASLGFSRSGSLNLEQSLEILRDTFHTSRLDLESILPGETSCALSDAPGLLKSFTGHVRNLLHRLEGSDARLDATQQTEAALRTHFNATLTKLSKSEIHVARLETRRHDLLVQTEKQGQVIAELQDQLLEREDKLDQYHDQSKDDKERLLAQEAEIHSRCKSIQRLQGALQSYRDEVARLEELVVKVEREKSEVLHELWGVLQKHSAAEHSYSRRLGDR